ncbi:hypothetical protein CLF_103542 [Clonorchis sinensis]|uniref:Uncharacterized protein n=1 Tax=Clonorchis sinensis TaxID=79923 RepID=G7YNI0_CLOSI|nr:hypothetical protein CLF_103542 [Clonorchis sinensis]
MAFYHGENWTKSPFCESWAVFVRIKRSLYCKELSGLRVKKISRTSLQRTRVTIILILWHKFYELRRPACWFCRTPTNPDDCWFLRDEAFYSRMTVKMKSIRYVDGGFERIHHISFASATVIFFGWRFSPIDNIAGGIKCATVNADALELQSYEYP